MTCEADNGTLRDWRATYSLTSLACSPVRQEVVPCGHSEAMTIFPELAHTAATNRSAEKRQEITRKSTSERRRRLYHIPRTVRFIELDELVTERVVPWWPHQRNRQRRKRPVFVPRVGLI